MACLTRRCAESRALAACSHRGSKVGPHILATHDGYAAKACWASAIHWEVQLALSQVDEQVNFGQFLRRHYPCIAGGMPFSVHNPVVNEPSLADVWVCSELLDDALEAQQK